jgi:hypothetical protein
MKFFGGIRPPESAVKKLEIEGTKLKTIKYENEVVEDFCSDFRIPLIAWHVFERTRCAFCSTLSRYVDIKFNSA